MKTEFIKYEDTEMGKITLDQIREEIKELTPKERELLYLDLSHEIKSVAPEIEKAWIEESKRRVHEIMDGTAVLYDGEEVMKEAYSILNEKL